MEAPAIESVLVRLMVGFVDQICASVLCFRAVRKAAFRAKIETLGSRNVAMRKFSRPGVQAAIDLSGQPSSAALGWNNALDRYNDMLSAKGGKELVRLDEELGGRDYHNLPFTKDDLWKVVQWKFLKGKPRHALKKLLESNTDKSVQNSTREALRLAADKDHQAALDRLCGLRGGGPATASAVLSFAYPDYYAFMDDEVIECLYENKRGYTSRIYWEVNDKCRALAESLSGDWTPRRVGMALWAAARLSACGEEVTMGSKRPSDREPGVKESDKKRRTQRKH